MITYANILVLVDLSSTSQLVVARAKAMASSGASIHLMHVIEYIPMEPMGESVLPTVQMENELSQRARQKMADLATATGFDAAQQIVTIGSIKAEVARTTEQLGIDLIVVGNHQRQGLKALFNFVGDEVLHASPCDVLAVHLPQEKKK